MNAALLDHVGRVGKLEDRTPLLMFPLRLETRFATAIIAGASVPQLWVRVYPDDCIIDAFQPAPSQTEIQSTQRYWAAMWRARGVEAGQRGAWRALVASHGSGRAAWLIANYQPLNPADEPQHADALALIIATDSPPADADVAALKTFWTAAWRAGDDRVAAASALDEFRADIGNDARAQELATDYRPGNFNDPAPAGVARADVQVVVSLLIFPPAGDRKVEERSWNSPATVRVLPEQLVLMGWVGDERLLTQLGAPIPWPLPVGPDPQAQGADQIRIVNGELVLSPDLRWLIDFDRAVEIGMGFRVTLDAQTQGGFDQLMVLGVRQTDPGHGQQLLEELLAHHRDGSSGFSLLAQGTPTNNTDDQPSGFSRADDADRSFDRLHNPGTPLRVDTPWNAKVDGEWLADALGIDYEVLDKVEGSRNADQREAQAMNVALWPATLGYGLETMLHPLFNDSDVAKVRWFFERFVTGRGLLPAIRLGAQPYGVLPATVLSRLTWTDQELPAIPGVETPAGAAGALSHINRGLAVMASDWAGMAQNVSRVGGPSADPQQTLLDIIGLQASSVGFDQRFAESVDDLYNRMRFYGSGSDFIAALTALSYEVTGLSLLNRLGYEGGDVPDALQRLFLDDPNPLGGPVIDAAPLTETTPLPAVSAAGNYIQWLRETAAASLDGVRQEQGFAAGPPGALLYLMLRHALLLSYWDSGLRLSLDSNVLDAAQVKAARKESPFVHVAQAAAASESRWQMLYQHDARLTENQPVSVAQYLATVIGTNPATIDLRRMLSALDVLAPLPTARLERLFAEHIDLCTYRVDAWQQGLVQYGLALSRYVRNNQKIGRNPGIYLGAFGWLESVRPRLRALTPVAPVPGVDRSFFAPGLPPLMSDSTNGGYIQAPSLNQAVAAAVLRNGYIANAGRSNPDSLAVNLSSRRVRVALSFLEGVRQGQSLGALLGYQLERDLHDAYGFAEVDQYIYALRRKFPLAADRSADTAAPGAPIQAVEARNVVDGLQLVNYVRPLQSRSYPYDLSDMPAADTTQIGLIDSAVTRLLDSSDAIADLAVAEGVYEAVLSNYDAAAAALDASGQGQLPPEPRVVQTPRSGRTVTHRFALHLEAGLDESVSPVGGIAVTPRALLEPAVNKWLAGRLPDPDHVGCTLQWLDPAGGTMRTQVVTQQDLVLQPIDMLWVASLETAQALSELDSRVLLFAHAGPVRPDCPVTIQYQTPIAGKLTFADVAALIRQLKPLVLHSRALRPTDATPSGSASRAADGNVRVKPGRVTKVFDAMDALRQELADFRDALAPLHEPRVNVKQILTGLDARLDALAGLMSRASRFGLPGSDWSFILTFRHDAFASVLDEARKLADRFATRLADADAQLAAYDVAQAGMTNAQRFAALIPAERRVRASITIPQPADPVAYRAAIGTARGQFAARLAAIRAMLTAATTRTTDLRAAFQAIVIGPLPLADLDPEPVASLLSVIQALADRFASRLADADAKLAAYDAGQAGMTDEQRFAALADAELSVRAALTTPQPALPADYRVAIGTARGVFAARLAAIRALLAAATAPNVDLLTPFQAILDGPSPIEQLDSEPVELPSFEDACVRASADLLARARSLVTLIQDRCLTPADALIQQAAASADSATAARLLGDAGKKLLGEDAVLLPEFTLDHDPAAAFQLAYAAATNGDPLLWQRTVAKTAEPMDTWLYGVARVRQKVRQWEAATIYAEAFDRAAPSLLPVQIPWNDGESWLGLEFPAEFAPSGERLCYTANFERPFDPAQPQCGLLVDDWTEVIPGTQETTGLTFHYDRPNAEAPQVLLLLTPPRFTGAWQWEDIVDGVRETFARAKSRVVEPTHVDQSAYARFLPMTTMAATLYQVSIMSNLARNNLFAIANTNG